MSDKKRCCLLAFMLLLASTSGGQAVPALVTGEMPASGFASAASLTNLTLISFSSSTVFDDNFSNSASHREGGAQQYLSTSFAWQQTRRRVRWNLSYQPGVMVGGHASPPNQFNQLFAATLEVQPTVRWSLKIRQDYMLTTDPFESLGEAPLQPGLGPLEQPNSAIVLPSFKRTSSFSGAGLSYRLSRHATVGLGGSYALQQYSDYADNWTGPLINSNAVIGKGYISRQFSRRYSAGLEYRLLELTFPGYDMRTLAHSVLAFQQFAVSANSSFVIYAGPEYSRTRGQTFMLRNTPAISASWSPAAGAIYTWSGMHTTLQAGFSRHISDGGGVQGPVRLNAGWLRVGRQLLRRCAADLNVGLAQQTALPATAGERLHLLRAGAGFSRELGRNASLRLGYERLYQASTSEYQPGNHNRVTLSIEHSFVRPLGR